MSICINGIQRRLPIIKLDGKEYFILGGTYQRLANEQIVTERYTPSGEIDRQIVNTGKFRFRFTIMTPLDATYITNDEKVHDFGDLISLRASAYLSPPDDLLQYWDISALGNFGGTYTHQVYMRTDWETPVNDDPGMWQVPIELWGYEE